MYFYQWFDAYYLYCLFVWVYICQYRITYVIYWLLRNIFDWNDKDWPLKTNWQKYTGYVSTGCTFARHPTDNEVNFITSFIFCILLLIINRSIFWWHHNFTFCLNIDSSKWYFWYLGIAKSLTFYCYRKNGCRKQTRTPCTYGNHRSGFTYFH